MIHLLIAAAVTALPISDAPTYDEQLRQCAEELRHTPYPLGTAGYASVYEACLTLEKVALQRETGNLIAQGRCADAVNLALRSGDLQLAASIRSYCSTPQR
jgi:hypothetical protein